MIRKSIAFAATTAVCALVAGQARAADPIKIGVIAEAQAVAGSSIAPAAQLAADEINAKGGVDGRQIQQQVLHPAFSDVPCRFMVQIGRIGARIIGARFQIVVW